ncbi:MAG: class I SAM-dependent RNA methyltransferase [Pseudomonadota bacterium]
MANRHRPPKTRNTQRRRQKRRAAGPSHKRFSQPLIVGPPQTGTVAHLADRGDGLVVSDANTDGDRYFVPGVLPGETIEFAGAVHAGGQPAIGQLLNIISASPHRVTPPCPHVSACGGCQLQHSDQDHISRFKQARIQRLLTQQGLGDVPVLEPIIAWAEITHGSRRRMEFAARRHADGVVFGLHRAQSRELVDLTVCPVAVPAIADALGPLRAFANLALQPGESADLHVTTTNQGLDLVLTRSREPSLDERLDWPAFLEAQGWPRLSWREKPHGHVETITAFTNPTISIAGQTVPIPPGGFIQATEIGQQRLITQALEHLHAQGRPGQRYLDLFSGLGTFTLPILAADPTGQVQAIDMAGASLDALQQAGGHYGSRLTVETRDLFRDPVPTAQLNGVDCVVFDPPRAGAEAQAENLAQSQVPTIVAVSCNPATFARDAKTLVASGYQLTAVQPVDQFQWSVETELIAAFRR